jgi:hypothetical protein
MLEFEAIFDEIKGQPFQKSPDEIRQMLRTTNFQDFKSDFAVLHRQGHLQELMRILLQAICGVLNESTNLLTHLTRLKEHLGIACSIVIEDICLNMEKRLSRTHTVLKKGDRQKHLIKLV